MMARRRSYWPRSSRFDDYDRSDGWGGFAPYVPVAARRAQAAREAARLKKSGRAVSPVTIAGTKIATTFWGKAWCDNLERYSDFSNRIPRGRTYVRNGSVIDLQIGAGRVEALVSGSEVYRVALDVAPVSARRWKDILARCAGGIASLVELLQGRFSKGVMAHICEQGTGLFPAPKEIVFNCSCPDVAYMCKHVAAVLYGVGARFDHQPELLFRLRQVDEQDLVAGVAAGAPLSLNAPGSGKVLRDGDLEGIFSVELAPAAGAAEKHATTGAARARKAGGAPRARGKAPATEAAQAKSRPAGAKAKSKPAAAKVKAKSGPAAAKTKTTFESAPAKAGANPVAPKPKPRRAPGRRKMTAREKAAISERMRQFWEEGRKRR